MIWDFASSTQFVKVVHLLAVLACPGMRVPGLPGGFPAASREAVLLEVSTAPNSGAAPGAGHGRGVGDPEKSDPILVELFNKQFASVSEQMGAMLQKTALSTNTKERLDFSCALFTATGDLVVNAPHIPVHLGGMSECIKQLLEDVPRMRTGEVYLTHDPFRGGSHLPCQGHDPVVDAR